MNMREAATLRDFLLNVKYVHDVELEQTGKNTWAAIKVIPEGVLSYVWLNEAIGIHFYQGTAWEDGDDPSGYSEVDV